MKKCVQPQTLFVSKWGIFLNLSWNEYDHLSSAGLWNSKQGKARWFYMRLSYMSTCLTRDYLWHTCKTIRKWPVLYFPGHLSPSACGVYEHSRLKQCDSERADFAWLKSALPTTSSNYWNTNVPNISNFRLNELFNGVRYMPKNGWNRAVSHKI